MAIVSSTNNWLDSATAKYLATEDGQNKLQALIAVNGEAYPDVAREYEGIADGAGLKPEVVYALAFAIELHGFAVLAGFDTAQPKACTDYHTMTFDGKTRAWGHTEDVPSEFANISFLVSSSIDGFRYTGFTYAPNVVGWAWGFNSHGIAQSVNALTPTNVSIGIGVNFLARDVLNSRSLDDAINRSCVKGLASGQHLNIGSVHEKDRQLLIETSPFGCNVQTLVPPTSSDERASVAFHTNRYESADFKGIDNGGDGESSNHRMTRMSTMENATSLQSLQDILSDTVDAEYPIHRNGALPDCCVTLNTVLFDVADEKVLVWGPTLPSRSNASLVLNWSNFESFATKMGQVGAFYP